MSGPALTAPAALRGFAGRVSLPGQPGYDRGRRAWQLTVDQHPALVAEAACAADVQVAVRAARELDLPFAVMGTGHGAVAPLDGGLLLQTSRLTGVRVDPLARTARVGAGTTWDEVVAAAEPYALVPVCGTASSVGVAGYTLQGGLGWLSRRFGFAADNLLEAEVVTADGDLVTASAQRHADLFWALRGGGGSFGVATALTFRLHPVPGVLGGAAYYPIERAEQVLATYRDWAVDEPRGLSTALLLIQMPDRPSVPEQFRNRRVLVVRAFALCDDDAGEARARQCLEPLLAAAGEPLLDAIAPTGFAEMLRRQGPPPPPVAATERIDLFDTLPDGALRAVLDAAGADADDRVACIEVKGWGGAIADSPSGAGPTSHRSTAFSAITGARFGGRPDQQVSAAVADTAAALAPYASGGSLLNLLADPTRTRTAFTADNWRGLTEVKRRWDAEDVFRAGHHVPPAPRTHPLEETDDR
ncbi:MAG TPA: FAD-binding oxidoreductase [Mycobacteriales bacterium]|nr:FAD-binding oxidoreductase [Mycobacteriales bacterium]